MSQTNFIIGRGELLTHDIKAPKGRPSDAYAYTFPTAVTRLSPQLKKVSELIDTLPDAACPNDIAVIKLAMNPSFISKSAFPKALLRSSGLDSIGSKTISLKPDSWTKKKEPQIVQTTELFIAGKRESIRGLSSWIQTLDPDSQEADDLTHIERFSTFKSEERIAAEINKSDRFYEVGIHLISDIDINAQQLQFIKYANSGGMEVYTKLSFRVGTLWFVAMEGASTNINLISQYAMVRVIRPMPKLRGMRPLAVRSLGGVSISCDLPTEQPLSAEPSVAILDGGLPDKHVLSPWLKSYKKMDDTAGYDPEGPEHGLGVTSSFLFGPITPGNQAARPYSYVNHLRVLDRDADDEDPFELYRTLGLVEQALLSRQYEFINLSLGPSLEMNDNEVHAWTAVIDDFLSDGNTFMTIAVGNNGEHDHSLGYDRIQIPSDCVNAVSVGATDDQGDGWGRAPYSAIGPGRCPGVVKPDLVTFGGEASKKYFHVLLPGDKPKLAPEAGTSFASPYILRSAVGIRAILGQELTPLAIKALLVHSADPSTHNKLEVGWGLPPEDLMEIITCPNGVARVVYQGELKPGKYLRAALPLPKGGLEGNIKLKATFCFASPVDPQDAAVYTCAGLDITFRPNGSKKAEGKDNADTKAFFRKKKYASEAELRSDFGKWETILHDEKTMRGSSLEDPSFDIHYNAREKGASTNSADKIKYALIITVEAGRHTDLYNDILRSYQNILVPLQPKVSLPIRT